MFGHEGGYTNNKADKGNWYNGKLVGTKYGITGKTLAAHRGKPVAAADVRNLTLAEAEAIYQRSYWIQSGGDLLPDGLDYAAFDFGVNSGPATAVKHLQKVVGVAQDGIVGGQTVDAVAKYGVERAIKDYCAERLRYMRGLSGWAKFGNGWTTRVNDVEVNATKMAKGAAVAAPKAPVPVGPQKAPPADKTVVEIVKKDPSLVVSCISALGMFAAGAGPIQWALAIAVVVGVGYAIYKLVKRERQT
jgi:lysozyme family protein